MKKLGKLEINSSTILKNQELLQLRGGYDGSEKAACRKIYYDTIITLGFVCVADCNAGAAFSVCISEYPDTSFATCLGLEC